MLFNALILGIFVIGVVIILLGLVNDFNASITGALGGALVGAAASLGASFVLEKLEINTHVHEYDSRLSTLLDAVSKMQVSSLHSESSQIDDLNLLPAQSFYHYSRIEENGVSVWQEAELIFVRPSSTTVYCEAFWLSPDGTPIPYRIELGVRGKRLFLTFTVCTGHVEEPTIEVFPKIFRPGEDTIAGIGIDDTYSYRCLVEPTLLSRKRLVSCQD